MHLLILACLILCIGVPAAAQPPTDLPIAIFEQSPATVTMFALYPDGSTTPLFGYSAAYRLQWSDNGERVYFLAQNDYQYDVYEFIQYDFTTGEETVLPLLNVQDFAFSPDETLLAYTAPSRRAGADLTLRFHDMEAMQDVVSGIPLFADGFVWLDGSFTWSPDGQQFAYVLDYRTIDRAEIIILDRDGHEQARYAFDSVEEVFDLLWVGDTLVITARLGIFLLNLVRGELQRIPDTSLPLPNTVGFNGQVVAYVVDRRPTDINLYDIGSGQTTTFPHDDHVNSLTFDGDTLIYTTQGSLMRGSDRSSTIFLIGPDDAAPTRIMQREDEYIYPWQWSPRVSVAALNRLRSAANP